MLERATGKDLEELLSRPGTSTDNLRPAAVIAGGVLRISTNKGKILLLERIGPEHGIEFYLIRYNADALPAKVGSVTLNQAALKIGKPISYMISRTDETVEDVGNITGVELLGKTPHYKI